MSQQKPFLLAHSGESVKDFQFSTGEDFFNEPRLDSFQFPSKSPENCLRSLPSTPKYLVSPIRKFGGALNNLNSPTRFKNEKSMSILTCPSTPKLFMTEATTLNDENIPDAVIDLDEILHANMHIEDHSDGDHDSMKRPQDDFLASPFARSAPNNQISSAHASLYSKQPIRELAADAIEEEDDLDEYKLIVEDASVENLSELVGNPTSEADSDIFTNPPDAFSGVYLTLSANSSNSSLPSANGTQRLPFLSIEKTSSNSSKDSGASTFFASNGSSASKRSSAKATRYQSFYDQSFKISSALKHSSTESIPLQSSENYSNSSIALSKDEIALVTKALGHSSSLPSLKSQVKRPVPMRYAELRAQRDSNASHCNASSHPFISSIGLVESKQTGTSSPSKSHGNTVDVQGGRNLRARVQAPPTIPSVFNSPASVKLEPATTMISNGESPVGYISNGTKNDRPKNQNPNAVVNSRDATTASSNQRRETPSKVTAIHAIDSVRNHEHRYDGTFPEERSRVKSTSRVLKHADCEVGSIENASNELLSPLTNNSESLRRQVRKRSERISIWFKRTR